MALVESAPEDFQDVLGKVFSCKSRAEAHAWLRTTSQAIVQTVTPRPGGAMGDTVQSGPRAFCPLCGRGADNIFQLHGFAYPEGLARHLEGSYNARHCNVMRAALGLAYEAAERSVQRPDQAAAIQSRRSRSSRRR